MFGRVIIQVWEILLPPLNILGRGQTTNLLPLLAQQPVTFVKPYKDVQGRADLSHVWLEIQLLVVILLYKQKTEVNQSDIKEFK